MRGKDDRVSQKEVRDYNMMRIGEEKRREEKKENDDENDIEDTKKLQGVLGVWTTYTKE